MIKQYTPALDEKIKNTENLPKGLGCRYLKCLIGHTGEYIAMSWHRKLPKVSIVITSELSGYVVIDFGGGK